jgi:hypothetical protein
LIAVTARLSRSELWLVVIRTVLAAMVCSVAIAACGGSASKPPLTPASKRASGLAFSKCMRSHGVPNFPDPNTSGGGFQITVSGGDTHVIMGGPGLNIEAPAFQDAQTACQHLLAPGAVLGHPAASAQEVNQALALAKCMRTHGVHNFPDPIASPPANPGNGDVSRVDGVYFWLHLSINYLSSPGFKDAASRCGFPNPG